MKIKNRLSALSPRNFTTAVVEIATQFTLTLIFIVAAFILTVWNIHTGSVSQVHWLFFLYAWTSGGTVLSLALRLWSATIQRKALSAGIQAAAHVALAGLLLYISQTYDMDSGDIRPVQASLAIALFICVMLVVLPFRKCHDDLALWAFVQKLAGWGCWSLLVAAIIFGGISLLLLSFDMLFGIEIAGNCYLYCLAGAFVLIAPLVFLRQLQTSGNLYQPSQTAAGRFSLSVVHYVLMPIIGAYLLTLYAYAVRIIIAWQLPVGWVSSLVSFSVAGMLVLTFMLYPVQLSGKAITIDRIVYRWLPAAILPLLILMSVGIGRRIADYGITNARIYLVVFNAWCYVMCITMLVTRTRRIAWIGTGFAVIGLVTSVGPWSLGNIVRRTMVTSVEASMRNSGFNRLPLSEADAGRWLKSMPHDEASTMVSRITYLENNYDTKTAARLVQQSGYSLSDHIRTETDDIFFKVDVPNAAIAIPEDYHTIAPVNGSISKRAADSHGDVTITVRYTLNGREQTATFVSSMSLLRSHASEKSRLILRRPDGMMLIVDNYTIQFKADKTTLSFCELNGYVLIK